MTEVWKSVGRYFCPVCKVWMADNKISRDNHDRGQKHIDMIRQRMRESDKRAQQRDKDMQNANSIIAQMEAAAVCKMVENGEDVQHGPQLPTGAATGFFDPAQFRGLTTPQTADSQSMGAMTPYFNASIYSGSGPELREAAGSQGEAKPVGARGMGMEYYIGGGNRQLPLSWDGRAEEVVWVECKDKERKKYYWNMYSGETTQKRPAEYLRADEYKKRLELLALAGQAPPEMTSRGVSLNRAAKRAAAKAAAASVGASLADLQEAPWEEKSTLNAADNEFLQNAVKQFNVDPDEEVPNTSADGMEIKEEQAHDDEPAESPKPSVYGAWTAVKKVANKEPVFSPLTAKFREEEERQRREEEEAAKCRAILEPDSEPPIVFEEKTAAVSSKKKIVEFKKKSGGPRNVRKRED